MSARKSKATHQTPEPPAVDQGVYESFIEQIELRAIWLVDAHVINRHGPTPPSDRFVEIVENTPRFDQRDGGFDAFASYRLLFGRDDAEQRSEIEATFGLRFQSAMTLTDELFGIFAEVNLSLIAWPFLREYVQSMLGRMNWPALTLPSLKVPGEPARQTPTDPAE